MTDTFSKHFCNYFRNLTRKEEREGKKVTETAREKVIVRERKRESEK